MFNGCFPEQQNVQQQPHSHGPHPFFAFAPHLTHQSSQPHQHHHVHSTHPTHIQGQVTITAVPVTQAFDGPPFGSILMEPEMDMLSHTAIHQPSMFQSSAAPFASNGYSFGPFMSPHNHLRPSVIIFKDMSNSKCPVH